MNNDHASDRVEQQEIGPFGNENKTNKAGRKRRDYRGSLRPQIHSWLSTAAATPLWAGSRDNASFPGVTLRDYFLPRGPCQPRPTLPAGMTLS